MHQQSFFRVTASVIMYFFIIIEIVRTLVLMSYGKKMLENFYQISVIISFLMLIVARRNLFSVGMIWLLCLASITTFHC